MEQQTTLAPSLLNTLPPLVREGLKKMKNEDHLHFLHEYQRRRKSTEVGYACWFFVGLHYAYVGKWGIQLLFWLTAGGLLIWWVVDLFRVGGIVRQYNQDAAVEVLKNVKLLA